MGHRRIDYGDEAELVSRFNDDLVYIRNMYSEASSCLSLAAAVYLMRMVVSNDKWAEEVPRNSEYSISSNFQAPLSTS